MAYRPCLHLDDIINTDMRMMFDARTSGAIPLKLIYYTFVAYANTKTQDVFKFNMQNKKNK